MARSITFKFGADTSQLTKALGGIRKSIGGMLGGFSLGGILGAGITRFDDEPVAEVRKHDARDRGASGTRAGFSALRSSATTASASRLTDRSGRHNHSIDCRSDDDLPICSIWNHSRSGILHRSCHGSQQQIRHGDQLGRTVWAVCYAVDCRVPITSRRRTSDTPASYRPNRRSSSS